MPLGDVAKKLNTSTLEQIAVKINDEFVDDWHAYEPKIGDKIEFYKVPGILNKIGRFFKKHIRTIATIAVVVAAPYAAGSLFTFGTAGYFAATAAFTLVGSLAINALIPPQDPGDVERSIGRIDEEKNYFISGAQNQIKPYGVIPKPLGTIRHFPPFAAEPYTYMKDDVQHIVMLVCWGYGPLDISNLKIGDNPITQYSGVQIQHKLSRNDAFPSLYPYDVFQDHSVGGVTLGTTSISRSTQTDCKSFTVEVIFPRGLVEYTDDGSLAERTVVLNLTYQTSGGAIHSASQTVTAKTTQPLRKTFTYTPSDGGDGKIFLVTIARSTAESTNTRVADEVQLASIITNQGRQPVNMDRIISGSTLQDLCLTAIDIPASGQIHSSVNTINAVVTSLASDYIVGSQTWRKKQPTNNPASLFRNVFEMAVIDADLELAINEENLAEWHVYCETHYLSFNLVVDYKTNYSKLLQDIARVGNATILVSNGEMLVKIDEETDEIAHHFTSRNSWDFHSETVYPKIPDVVRVRFQNEDKNYLLDEVLVYNNGKSASNALSFEVMEFRGVTNSSQAYALASKTLDRARIANTIYKLNVDAEHLLVKRGDRVRVTNTVLQEAITAGRITEITKTTPYTFKIDTDTTITGDDKVAEFRTQTGVYGPAWITIGADGLFTVPDDVPNWSNVNVGDLVVLGTVREAHTDCQVKEIARQENMNAELTLIDYYGTALNDHVPDNPPLGTRPESYVRSSSITFIGITTNSTTEVATTASTTRASGELLFYAPAVDAKGSSRRVEAEFKLASETTWRFLAQTSAATGFVAFTNLEVGSLYDFRLRSVNEEGISSSWVEQTYRIPIVRSGPPPVIPPVENVRLAGEYQINEYFGYHESPTANINIIWDPGSRQSDPRNPWIFSKYVVRIYNSFDATTPVRTAYPTTESFTYTLEMNKADNDGEGARALRVEVTQMSVDQFESSLSADGSSAIDVFKRNVRGAIKLDRIQATPTSITIGYDSLPATYSIRLYADPESRYRESPEIIFADQLVSSTNSTTFDISSLTDPQDYLFGICFYDELGPSSVAYLWFNLDDIGAFNLLLAPSPQAETIFLFASDYQGSNVSLTRNNTHTRWLAYEIEANTTYDIETIAGAEQFDRYLAYLYTIYLPTSTTDPYFLFSNSNDKAAAEGFSFAPLAESRFYMPNMNYFIERQAHFNPTGGSVHIRDFRPGGFYYNTLVSNDDFQFRPIYKTLL